MECRLSTVECGCRLLSVECRVWSLECNVSTVEYGVSSERCQMQKKVRYIHVLYDYVICIWVLLLVLFF